MFIPLIVDKYQSFIYVLYIYVKELLIIILSRSVDADGSNDEKYQGCICGFPAAGDGEEGVKARGQDLAEGGGAIHKYQLPASVEYILGMVGY